MLVCCLSDLDSNATEEVDTVRLEGVEILVDVSVRRGREVIAFRIGGGEEVLGSAKSLERVEAEEGVLLARSETSCRGSDREGDRGLVLLVLRTPVRLLPDGDGEECAISELVRIHVSGNRNTIVVVLRQAVVVGLDRSLALGARLAGLEGISTVGDGGFLQVQVIVVNVSVSRNSHQRAVGKGVVALLDLVADNRHNVVIVFITFGLLFIPASNDRVAIVNVVFNPSQVIGRLLQTREGLKGEVDEKRSGKIKREWKEK